MYTKVTMMSRAIEAKVYAERNRCPSWILCATVEAYLDKSKSVSVTQGIHGDKENLIIDDFLLNKQIENELNGRYHDKM
jgi:hypothetical protein